MKKNSYIIFATVFALALFLQSPLIGNEPIKGPAFALSNEESTLHWKGTKPGGGHYGVVKVVNGKIQTDGQAITGGSFEIDLNTIVCHDLKNEQFNERLVNHLKSDDFFDTENHPKAFFNIKKVEKMNFEQDDFVGTHKVVGDLTVRGVTKEIVFPAKLQMVGDQVMAETSEIVLDRTEWNVNYNSKKLFANLADNYIDDEMRITLDLHFDIQ